MHVLVVEDNRDLRFLVDMVAELRGVEVHTAPTLDDARACIDECRPDRVVLDWHLEDGRTVEPLLPALDGLDASVVVWTTDERVAERATELGLDFQRKQTMTWSVAQLLVPDGQPAPSRW